MPPTPYGATHAARENVRFAVVLVTSIAIAIALLWYLADVWLLAFGGALLAAALHGAGRRLSGASGLPETAATGVVCALAFALSLLVFVALGPALTDGFARLREELPAALERARALAASYPPLSGLIDEISGSASGSLSGSDILGRFGELFSTALGALSALSGALVGAFVICVVALYGALNPSAYTGALLAVIPPARRGRAREVLGRLAHALRWWLLGRACSMLVVGLLSWLGLLLLGVPSAGTLGMLAALLSFVPNVGPILSAVPAVLLGLGQSPATALYVIGLYAAVQTVESYAITPLIQQRVVALPPAIVIVVQLAFGTVLGVLGLLFATPLAVVIMVLAQALWIEDVLGGGESG